MDKVFKLYKKMHDSKFALKKKIIHIWLRTIYGCDIMPQTLIGEGTRFPHNALGVVINQDSVIGQDCVIGKGVVIGGRNGITVVPTIEDSVEIGANAIVIGDITVGKGAQIGAGSVVLRDVPPYCVVVGNPARIIKNLKTGEKYD